MQRIDPQLCPLPASPSAVFPSQLGCSFFQTLSQELSSCDYGRQAVEEYFRPLLHAPGSDSALPQQGGHASYVARAVLIDMEPKVGGGRKQCGSMHA